MTTDFYPLNYVTRYSLSYEWRLFLCDLKEKAHEHNVTVILSDDRVVLLKNGTECNGYFNVVGTEPPTLAIACGQPQENWLQTLVHESCHMDQWIENTKEWQDCIVVDNIEALDLVELWIDKKIELNKKQLNYFINASRNIELDCEKRAVDKIMKYNLPITISEYIQRANSYIFFYTLLKQTRRWYKIGNEPYNNKEIWTQMPNYFISNYDKVPKKVKEVLLKII